MDGTAHNDLLITPRIWKRQIHEVPLSTYIQADIHWISSQWQRDSEILWKLGLRTGSFLVLF